MKAFFFLLMCCCPGSFLLAQQSGTVTINSNGLSRSFLVHLPNNNLVSNLPVLLVLHGDGGTGAGIQGYSGFDAVADAQNFIAVYPNSTAILGNGIWNKPVNDDANDGPDDVLFISDVIDHLCQNYGIDRNRVYVSGHSGGAFMAYHLAVALPGKIAAIAPVAGSMYGDNTFINNYLGGVAFVKIPICHIHGDNDNTVAYPDPDNQPVNWDEWPLSGFSYPTCGAMTYQQASVSDVTAGVKKIPFCSNGAGSKEICLIRILGGGHGWPAVAGYNAAEYIWNFVKDYQLNIAGACNPVSVAEIEGTQLLDLYPNPAQDRIKLSLDDTQLHSLQILDMRGCVLYNANITTALTSIDISFLETGVYILQVRMQDGSELRRSFIKQ
ncbi:MAG: T9SS type A sorting domain-containing protein [Bacteroidia bacterium]|nr:T9SS type A sorting domain-containing protein [Bacteroidia bacterium]